MPVPRSIPPTPKRPLLGLRGQLLLTLAAIVVGLLLSIGLIAHTLIGRAIEREARAQADAIAGQAAALLTHVADGRRPLPGPINRQRVGAQLHRLKALPGVVELRVVTRTGERLVLGNAGRSEGRAEDPRLTAALAGRSPRTRLSGTLLLAYRPVRIGNSRPAALRVSFSPERLASARLSATRWTLLVLAVIDGILVLLFGAVFLSRRILRPIRELERASARVAAGDRHARVKPGSSDELGRLARSFNDMVEASLAKDLELDARLGELTGKQREIDQSWEVLLRSAKLASVGRLAAGVAHELGNPMSSILGYLELLNEPELSDEERAGYLDKVRRELQRMDRTIRSLLDTARPGDDAVIATDLSRVIRQAAELARHQQRLRNVEIRLRLDPDLPRAAASGRLSQVFVNLLLNAGDAIAKRGDVTIQAAVHAHQLRVTVTDTGRGIPSEARGALFDPFFTTKPPGEGTGLGLAISQSILEASGGEILLTDPQPARGTSFTILLPIWRD